MSRSSRSLALLSYLLSLPGALLVLLVRRSDPFAVYHARQSLALGGCAVAAPLVWALVAWPLAWVQTVGPMLGVVLFALVIAVEIGLLVSACAGAVYALRGQMRPAPLVGRWVRPRAAHPQYAAPKPAEQPSAVDG